MRCGLLRRVLDGVAGIVLVAATGSPARCEDDAPPSRPPMPEPILTETVTDLDGTEHEVELEANASTFRARRGGAVVFTASGEVEWLVTSRLGLRVEPAVQREVEAGGLVRTTSVGASGAVSWKLLRDFRRDVHVQAEIDGRLPFDAAGAIEPGDPALPFAFDVRGGVRRGPLTLRGLVGVGAGGEAAHAPLRAGLAALSGAGAGGRFGFFGLELDADGARRAPVVLALDLVPSLTPLGLPLRLGLAVPWAVGARGGEPSIGLVVRVFVVDEEEVEFGRTGRVAAP